MARKQITSWQHYYCKIWTFCFSSPPPVLEIWYLAKFKMEPKIPMLSQIISQTKEGCQIYTKHLCFQRSNGENFPGARMACNSTSCIYRTCLFSVITIGQKDRNNHHNERVTSVCTVQMLGFFAGSNGRAYTNSS